MPLIMLASLRRRVRPAPCRAPRVGTLLLLPARLSVVVYPRSKATTSPLIADMRRPLERDESGTDQNGRLRAAAMLPGRLRRAGGLEDAVAESPGGGRAVRRPAQQSRPASSAVVGRKWERARPRRTMWFGRPRRRSRRRPRIPRSRLGRGGLRRTWFGRKRTGQPTQAQGTERTYRPHLSRVSGCPQATLGTRSPSQPQGPPARPAVRTRAGPSGP